MLISPCYDKTTRTDCPLRTSYCKSTCESWKTYEARKMAEYEDRKAQIERSQADIYHIKNKINQMKRRRNRR